MITAPITRPIIEPITASITSRLFGGGASVPANAVTAGGIPVTANAEIVTAT